MHQVRAEIKAVIKAGIPESECITMELSAGQRHRLNWIRHGHEFELNGERYDIVKQKDTDQGIKLFCIKDTREEQLFRSLNDHVNRHFNEKSTEGPVLKKMFDLSFTDVFPELALVMSSYATPRPSYHSLVSPGYLLPVKLAMDKPPQPPRTI